MSITPLEVDEFSPQTARAANTLAKMVDVLFQVDGIYQMANNFGGRVGLLVAGGKVQHAHVATAHSQVSTALLLKPTNTGTCTCLKSFVVMV